MRGIIATSAAAVLALIASSARAQPPAPPANWQQSIDKYLEGKLLDPAPAVKRISRGPRFDRLQLGFFKMPPGWLVCYEINSRNAYGGYTGLHTYLFRVDEGGVQQDLHDPNISLTIQAECARPADPDPAAEVAEAVKPPA